MRLPVLRETRMPAVLVELGPVRHVVEQAPEISLADAAWVTAILSWVVCPTSIPRLPADIHSLLSTLTVRVVDAVNNLSG